MSALQESNPVNRAHSGKNEVIETLRLVMRKEQELYRLYAELAEKDIDEELREVVGHLAYEEFVHLSTIMEKYKAMIDKDTAR